jgi:hypothetical protein
VRLHGILKISYKKCLLLCSYVKDNILNLYFICSFYRSINQKKQFYQLSCECKKSYFRRFHAKSTSFSEEKIVILNKWFLKNLSKPYANKSVKESLATETHLSIAQITMWLINRRKKFRLNKKKRILKFKNGLHI